VLTPKNYREERPMDIDILAAAKWIVGVAGGLGVLWAVFV
jgi:hypothetical protein